MQEWVFIALIISSFYWKKCKENFTINWKEILTRNHSLFKESSAIEIVPWPPAQSIIADMIISPKF